MFKGFDRNAESNFFFVKSISCIAEANTAVKKSAQPDKGEIAIIQTDVVGAALADVSFHPTKCTRRLNRLRRWTCSPIQMRPSWS